MITRLSTDNTVESALVSVPKINPNAIKFGNLDFNKIGLDDKNIYSEQNNDINGTKTENKFNKVSRIRAAMAYINPITANVTTNNSLFNFIPLEVVNENYKYVDSEKVNETVKWKDILEGSLYLDLSTDTFKKISEADRIVYSDDIHCIGAEAVRHILDIIKDDIDAGGSIAKRIFFDACSGYELSDYQTIREDMDRKAKELYTIFEYLFSNDRASGYTTDIAKELKVSIGAVYNCNLQIKNGEVTKHNYKSYIQEATAIAEFQGYWLAKDEADRLLRETASLSSNIAKASVLLKDINKFYKVICNDIFILPIAYRPGLDEKDDNLTERYNEIITNNGRLLLAMSNPQASVNSIGLEYKTLIKSISYVMNKDKPYIDNKDQYKNIHNRLSGKEGLIRDIMLGGRIDYSGRSVITVDKEMPIGWVGLPKKIATAIFELILAKVQKSSTTGNLTNYIQNATIADMYNLVAEIMEGCYILIGRQPTLYYLGIQAKKVKIIDGNVMVLSPLDVTAFNADFDGDQMHMEAIIDCTRISGEWVSEDVKPFLGNIQYYYPKDGKPVVEFRHEILYGLFIGNYITNNKEYYCSDYDERTEVDNTNVDKLVNDICNNKLSPVHNIGNCTALQFIVATLLNMNPTEISPKFIKDDISSAALSVYESIADKNAAKERYEYIINTLTKLGFGIAKLFPPDISLMTKQEMANISDTYDSIIDNIKSDIARKQDSPFTRSNDKTLVHNAYAKIESEDAKIQDGIDNDWKALIRSNARGKMINIQQSLLNKGLISDCSDNVKCNVVMSSYSKGITMYESFITANGGRAGLIAKNISTAEPGYLARLMAYAAGDIEITTNDCGTEKTLDINRQLIIDTQQHLQFDKFQPTDTINVDGTEYKVADRSFIIIDTNIYHKDQFDNNNGKYEADLDGIPVSIEESELKTLVGVVKPFYLGNYDKTKEKSEQKFIKEVITGRYVNDILVTKDNFKTFWEMYKDNEVLHMHSPLFCEDKCCRKCYGVDIRKMPLNAKTRVGLIAAQSAAEPSTQLVMKLFQSGGVEREGGLDSDLEKLVKILNGTPVEDFITSGNNGIKENDIDTYIKYATMRILNIFWKGGKKVNSKHIEIIVSSLVRYIDGAGDLIVTKKNNTTGKLTKVYLGLTGSAQLSSNMFNRIALENFNESLSYTLLGNDYDEESIIEKEAFGLV